MWATGSPDSRNRESGATLLEMLVVMGLLLMATAIIFPNLRRPYSSLSMEAARGAVADDLREARAEAIRTGRPVEFEVSAEGRSYGYDGGRVLLPAKVQLASAPESIVFAADGSSPGAHLLVREEGRRPLGLDVATSTGVVSRSVTQ